MFYLRWLPTFLGHPLGGLVAVHTAGSVDGPVNGALAGFVAGVVIGAVQWLALRAAGVGPAWIAATAFGFGAGAGIGAAVTDAGTSTRSLVVFGLVAGLCVGAAQGVLLGRGYAAAAAWTVAVGAGWALAWLVTANVIVDADRGYVVFGSSGALAMTALVGLVLVWIVRRPTIGEMREPSDRVAASGGAS